MTRKLELDCATNIFTVIKQYNIQKNYKCYQNKEESYLYQRISKKSKYKRLNNGVL